MPEFTFEEATQAPKTFSFEEASAPKSFTFEEAQTATASPTEQGLKAVNTAIGLTDTALRSTEVGLMAPSLPDEATKEANALLGAQTPMVGSNQPSFMSQPAPAINPRDIVLESRARRGPEIGPSSGGEPISDPEAKKSPSLLNELFTAPIGLGTFSKFEGITVAPGSEAARARDLAAGEGHAPMGIPTPTSEFLSHLPEGAFKDFSTGIYNAAATLFNTFISPAGVATLGSGSLPAAAQKALSATFAYQMAKGAPEELKAGDEAMQRGDIQGAMQHWLSGAASIGMAGMAARHLQTPQYLGKRPPVITPELETLAPQTAAAVLETTPTKEVISEPEPAPETKASATVSEVTTPTEATEVKAPVAADVVNEVTTLPAIGEAIKHPVVGQAFIVPRQLRLADAPVDTNVTVESVKRGQDTRGGSQTIEVKFSDGITSGRNAGQQSDGTFIPVDGIVQQILSERKARPSPAPEVSSPGLRLVELQRKVDSGIELDAAEKSEYETLQAASSATNSKAAFDKLQAESDAAKAASANAPKETAGDLAGPGGAAVPSEFEKDFRTGTGIKKAAITAAREERGAEPSEIKAGKQPQQEVHDRVMKQLDEDPAWPDRLVSELSTQPRALNADEVLVLDTRYVDLQNEYRKAVDEAIQAESDGRADAVLEGKRKADYWEQKLTEFEIMARSTGTHWGRTGAMMQRTMKADFSLEAMERRARAAKNFEPLTPDEHAKVKAFNEELQAKVKELEERQKAVVEEAVKEALDRVEKESKTDQPAYHPRVLKLAERFATYMDKQADSALARIKDKMGRTSAGVDPTILSDLAIVGAAKITRGIVELSKWSDAMIRDVGDWIKPHLDEVRKASEAKFETETTALDKKHGAAMGERVRKAIKKTEPADAKANITEKLESKAEKGELGDITPLVQKLARSFVESGIKERDALIDAVHDVLKDILPDHTRRDTMDAISGYGKFKRLTKDDISVTLRDLKGQMQQVAKLEDMASGEAPLKTGIERRRPSDLERQLIAQVNEAKKKGGYEVTNPELQLASALSTRLTAIRNRITDLTDEIAKGERNITERKQPPTSPAIETSKAELAKLREEHAKVFNLALEKLKSGIKRRISTLEKRMSEKDFAPKPKRPAPESDPELLKLKGDLESVQERYQGMLEKWKFDNLSVVGKSTHIAGSAWDAARNIMTTGELSFVLRQGKAFVLSRPIMASRAFVKSLRALASERVARAAELRIRSEPEYADSQTAKLHISREGDKLSRQEELITGRWSNVIPILRAFNRAAVTFLNELRWESWLAMRKTFSRGGKSTPSEDIQFAKMANEATGRGGLGFAEPAAVTLGRFLFSPRYLVSRLQMAIGHSLWGGTLRSRAVIATEYARILTGYFVYLNLLQVGLNALLPDDKKAKVSFDPRSADFGKIVIGDTRLDIMAGLAQLATFAGRSVTGETKNAKGKVSVLRPQDGKKVPFGGANWYDVAGRFTLSKTHPGISYVGNLLNGVDLVGNETSLATETGKLIGPITYVDIYQALRAQGLEEGAALAILAFLGEGLQTYQPKK